MPVWTRSLRRLRVVRDGTSTPVAEFQTESGTAWKKIPLDPKCFSFGHLFNNQAYNRCVNHACRRPIATQEPIEREMLVVATVPVVLLEWGDAADNCGSPGSSSAGASGNDVRQPTPAIIVR